MKMNNAKSTNSTTKNQQLPPLKISKVSSLMRGGELSSRLLDTLTFKYQKSLPSLPVPKLEGSFFFVFFSRPFLLLSSTGVLYS